MPVTAMSTYLEFLAWFQQIADRAPRALPVIQRMITNLQADATELYSIIYGRAAQPIHANELAGRALTAEESAAESAAVSKLNDAAPRSSGEGQPRQLWDGTFLRAIFDMMVKNPQLLQWLMSLLMKPTA